MSVAHNNARTPSMLTIRARRHCLHRYCKLAKSDAQRSEYLARAAAPPAPLGDLRLPESLRLTPGLAKERERIAVDTAAARAEDATACKPGHAIVSVTGAGSGEEEDGQTACVNLHAPAHVAGEADGVCMQKDASGQHADKEQRLV